MAQHKATKRQSLRSALSHKKLADDLLDSMASMQTRMSSLLTQMNTDGTTMSDYSTGYESASTIVPDAAGTQAQHKASQRASLRSALRNKGLADDLIDSMDELDASMDYVVSQLVLDNGVAPGTNGAYAAGAVTEDDPSASAGDAPHKASRRRSLEVSLCHSSLSDAIIDSLVEMQNQWNQVLPLLDGGDGTNTLSVTVIDPDAP
jgi:hypothetical protein